MNHPDLSPRENEVAELVALGCVNKEIAAELGVSAFTVTSYLRRIFAKLGVTNRAEMVARLLGVPAPVRDPVGLLTSCPRCGYDLTGGVAS